jgi:hypothetical protein
MENVVVDFMGDKLARFAFNSLEIGGIGGIVGDMGESWGGCGSCG